MEDKITVELTLEEVNSKLKQLSDSLQDLVIYKNTQENTVNYFKNKTFYGNVLDELLLEIKKQNTKEKMFLFIKESFKFSVRDDDC